ncbi:hypothetical protein TNCV_102991 [Trichonephila clavipes]|nr:hypothetical protein TNCV_102991 [Trichonephila clavipes]
MIRALPLQGPQHVSSLDVMYGQMFRGPKKGRPKNFVHGLHRTPSTWDIDFLTDRMNEFNAPTEGASLVDAPVRLDRPLCISFIVQSVSNLSRRLAILKRVGGSVPCCCLQCRCTSLCV